VKAFLAGVIIGILLAVLGILLYFISGRAPAAVEDQPIPFERVFANGALHARIENEAPKAPPMAAKETEFIAGAQVYREHCGICHGFPNVEQTPMARGMFPKPPELFKGKGVTDDSVGETYWKVANGIRLTGMPEFKHTLSQTQMWQVSLLLAYADKLSDMVKQELKPPAPPAGPNAPMPTPPDQGLSGKPATNPTAPPPVH